MNIECVDPATTTPDIELLIRAMYSYFYAGKPADTRPSYMDFYKTVTTNVNLSGLSLREFIVWVQLDVMSMSPAINVAQQQPQLATIASLVAESLEALKRVVLCMDDLTLIDNIKWADAQLKGSRASKIVRRSIQDASRQLAFNSLTAATQAPVPSTYRVTPIKFVHLPLLSSESALQLVDILFDLYTAQTPADHLSEIDI